MRVAFISTDPGVPVFGSKGCSAHVQAMLRFFLRDVGAEITLYTPRSGGEAPDDLSDVIIQPLKLPAGSTADRERALMDLNYEVENRLNSDGAFDLMYERYALFAHAGMAHARRSRTPGILEVNAPLISEQVRHRHLLRVAEAESSTYRAFEEAAAVVAVSDGVADYVLSRCRSPRKVHVVPNGVDTDRFRPDASGAAPRPSGTFTIGFVGSLKPWHGLGDLVKAFRIVSREVPEARLLVVGDGPERGTMETALCEAGLRDAATFVGAVPHGEVPPWLVSMDVAVAPYPQPSDCYFSPLKVFEYMAAGLPVVATATGQIEAIVENGKTGLLTPPGRADELASALLTLHHNRNLMLSMGQAARRRAVSRHTWSETGRKILEIAGLHATAAEEMP